MNWRTVKTSARMEICSNLSWLLDYEGMYKQLSKEKKGSKEIRNSVILGSTALEFAITQLVEIGAKKLEISPLKEAMKKAFVPISKKLKLLRDANVIDQNLYENLTILFRIRNRFAHEIFFTSKDSEPALEPLKDAHITDSFLKTLPNDSIKFQLLTSECFVDLLYISKKLDPSSVLELELVSDIVPVEE